MIDQPSHRDLCMPEVNKFLSKHDTRGWKVLELGAGDDPTFRSLFESVGMTYAAIDPLPITNGNHCYQGLMQALPFVAEQFDLIFSCHAFEHTERPVDTLKECFRTIKKNGNLVFLTPNYCEHHILRADQDHINVISEMQMKRLLQYTGFTDISVYTSALDPKIENHNLISIAVKK